MSLGRFRILFSVAAIIIAVLHVVFPKLGIDLTTVTLVLLAILPWFVPFLKSLELPGGFKIELKDLKSAIDKMTNVTLNVSNSVHKHKTTSTSLDAILVKDDPFATLKHVAQNDPGLAFVGFRIELEKRLLQLAQQLGIETHSKSLRSILNELNNQQLIPSSIASGLFDLIALGNQAAHGATVKLEATEWLLDIGPSLLDALDDLISERKKKEDP